MSLRIERESGMCKTIGTLDLKIALKGDNRTVENMVRQDSLLCAVVVVVSK